MLTIDQADMRTALQPSIMPGDGPTTTHLFCGAGGDVRGFYEAGFQPVEMANHDEKSIETVSYHYKHVDPRCVNLDHYNMSSLKPSQVLVGSPICTEIAQAGGSTAPKAQTALFEDEGHVAKSTWERTRVTAWCLLRAAEAHRYDMVIGENVPEFATRWMLFPEWLRCWRVLGYQVQLVSVDAAHISGLGNQPAPQHRHRLVFVFTRKDIRQPDLRPRPDAMCPECGPVQGVQRWRDPRPRVLRVGKHGEQYDYVCPNRRCGHLIVEPVVWPVAPVIDWDLPMRRIGDGKKGKKFRPYAESTRVKVGIGLEQFGNEPFMALLRKNLTVQGLDAPLPTVTAGGNHFALIAHIGRDSAARTTDQPLTTVATHPHHALIAPALSVDNSELRMLGPDETKQVQRFRRDYRIFGNIAEQRVQIGNAVPVNVAHWVAARARAVLS
ncbi:DNA cytosine methyltransferase [Nonomuraea sp. NPDC050547]|uniref:DNA cytosine methyltransferase n=1 Tax=Nonomuraea sp. NPDC050547 TaxID=3364368 RepID=UPI00378D0C14